MGQVRFYNGVVLFGDQSGPGEVAMAQDCCCVSDACCPVPPQYMRFVVPSGGSFVTEKNTGTQSSCDGCQDIEGEHQLELIALGEINTPCSVINNFINSPTIGGLQVPVFHWALEVPDLCTVFVNQPPPIGPPPDPPITFDPIGCVDAEGDSVTAVFQLILAIDFVTGGCFFHGQMAWYNVKQGASTLQICRNYNYSGTSGSGPIDVAGGYNCVDPGPGSSYSMEFDVANSSETNPGYPDPIDQEYCWLCLVTQSVDEPVNLHTTATRGEW